MCLGLKNWLNFTNQNVFGPGFIAKVLVLVQRNDVPTRGANLRMYISLAVLSWVPTHKPRVQYGLPIDVAVFLPVSLELEPFVFVQFFPALGLFAFVWLLHLVGMYIHTASSRSAPFHEPLSVHTHIHTHICNYLFLPPHIHTYVFSCPYVGTYTYIHTYIHTNIHAYIHTYIHTYICTYIHTYIGLSKNPS